MPEFPESRGAEFPEPTPIGTEYHWDMAEYAHNASTQTVRITRREGMSFFGKNQTSKRTMTKKTRLERSRWGRKLLGVTDHLCPECYFAISPTDQGLTTPEAAFSVYNDTS